MLAPNHYQNQCWLILHVNWAQVKSALKSNNFRSRKLICKDHLQNVGHFVQVSKCWWKFSVSLQGGDESNYSDVIMSAMMLRITGASIVCSTVGSGADERKHQSSASLAFVFGIHRWPVNSPHKGPVARKMSLFDDIIMDACFMITFHCFQIAIVTFFIVFFLHFEFRQRCVTCASHLAHFVDVWFLSTVVANIWQNLFVGSRTYENVPNIMILL